MKSLVAIICISLSVTTHSPNTRADDDQPPAILTEWQQQNLKHTGFTADMSVISYDHNFSVAKYGTGRIGCRSNEQQAFYRVTGADDARPLSRFDKKGEPYKVGPYSSEHFTLSKEWIRDIDDEHKTVIMVERPRHKPPAASAQETLGQRRTRMFAGIPRNSHPFLPGDPWNTDLSEWRFTETKKTETAVWLHATPREGTWSAESRSSVDLVLQWNPVRLLAIQTTDPAETGQTVLNFANVRFNPPAWPEPELAGYKVHQLGSTPSGVQDESTATDRNTSPNSPQARLCRPHPMAQFLSCQLLSCRLCKLKM